MPSAGPCCSGLIYTLFVYSLSFCVMFVGSDQAWALNPKPFFSVQGQPHQEGCDQHLLRRHQARSDEPIIYEGGVAERAGDDC